MEWIEEEIRYEKAGLVRNEVERKKERWVGKRGRKKLTEKAGLERNEGERREGTLVLDHNVEERNRMGVQVWTGRN